MGFAIFDKELTIITSPDVAGYVSFSGGGAIDLKHIEYGTPLYCYPSYINCVSGSVYVGIDNTSYFELITSESVQAPRGYQLLTYNSSYVTYNGNYVVVKK